MTTRDRLRWPRSNVGRNLSTLTLVTMGLIVLNFGMTPPAGAGNTTLITPGGTAASDVAAANSATRWIAVPVGTLWVSPGTIRPVDRLTIATPVSIRSWIATMTLGQKEWLVGRIETQALYGTQVTVTSVSGKWSHVVVPSQPTPRDRRGYPGWIPTGQLTSRSPEATPSFAIVTSPTTWVRSASGAVKSNLVMEISYDTRLPVVSSDHSSIEVSLLDGRHGYVLRKNVSLHAAHKIWSANRTAVIAESKKFIGLPYLWGGTSGFGYDCSGFTYSVYHVLGVTIPRDAAPQATKGTPVLRQNLRPGDLVFFRDRTGVVVHVAIFYGSINGVPSVIHAPSTGQSVSITPLSSWPGSSYAGARRYVP